MSAQREKSDLTIGEVDRLYEAMSPRLMLSVREKLDSIESKLDALHNELSVVKAKAGLWGAMAGFFAAVGGWIATVKMSGK